MREIGKPSASNLSRKERRAIIELRKDKDRTIKSAYKKKAIITMDTKNYNGYLDANLINHPSHKTKSAIYNGVAKMITDEAHIETELQYLKHTLQ
ncbi:hypothetical protein Trydic_g11425 [Trypoxylus dichotomus]